MRTLSELKERWFIDTPTFASLGLNFRHPGATLENHTDGNNITILGDGDIYMGKWYDIITNPDITVVYNTNWRLDNVLTKSSNPLSTAVDTLIRVNNGPATVYQFVDGNKLSCNTNIISNGILKENGVITTRDFRFPVNGSNHMKFTVAKTSTTGWALVGSIDITVNRLDDNTHSGNFDEITHDFGVLVEGPAIADIEKTFVDRWNDSSRTRNWPFEAIDPDQPEITEPIGTYNPIGSHSVQVLRTYGVGIYSYSWADEPGEGEFSIWGSTLNAIKNAETYIYIEDQTLLTFGWPACCDDIWNPAGQASDLVYQLGEAMKRGVRVGIILSKGGSSLNIGPNKFETFQRHYSLNFLSAIADANGSNFFVASLDNGTGIIYVHSKMFMVDDEFALIGSANFDQRSMCHDGELKLGIVDENNLFVKTLRSTLYQEHSQQPATNFDDPVIAFENMKAYVLAGTGRLRNYDFSYLSQPYNHASVVNGVGWPYAGPVNLR